MQVQVSCGELVWLQVFCNGIVQLTDSSNWDNTCSVMSKQSVLVLPCPLDQYLSCPVDLTSDWTTLVLSCLSSQYLSCHVRLTNICPVLST